MIERIEVAPTLYTLREIAAVCRVSLATVRYWVVTERIDSIRPGRLRMVTGQALTAFLHDRRKKRSK